MKILNQLTIKHLLMNKKRTIVTIIGVLLSTALMVGIGLLLSTMQDNALKTAIAYEGNWHASFRNIEEKKLSIIENNKDVSFYYYENLMGFVRLEENENLRYSYLSVKGVSEDYFEQLTLLNGRYPNNDQEIVIDQSLIADRGEIYKIGDVITLELGDRDITHEGSETLENEMFTEKEKKQYTIVGIVDSPYFGGVSSDSYPFYTVYQGGDVTAFICYQKPKNTFASSQVLALNLGLEPITSDIEANSYEEVNYNYSVLSMYGVSKYDNITGTLATVLCIVLTLISIGCMIVIYNSFAISVMERKKQFGLFSSIGATKKQLRHTVFFEALIVGLIGIPLGVLSSFLGIGIVLTIVNHLLPGMFTVDLALTVTPEFLMIPIVFMVIVIFVSAYIPAFMASRITPIEAIRLNDDIKIKSKKIKTHKWIRKLFGVEGEIALKNIKRNKKKYRITVVSLIVSVVLFVSFSTFVEYGLKTSDDLINLPDFDISLRMDYPNQTDYASFIHQLGKYEGVEDSVVVKSGVLYSPSYSEEILNDTLKRYYFGDTLAKFLSIQIIALDDDSYYGYLNELGLKIEQPILLNTTSFVYYEGSNRKSYRVPVILDSKQDYVFDLCHLKTLEVHEKMQQEEEPEEVRFDCIGRFEEVYFTDRIPFGLKQYIESPMVTVVVSMGRFETLFKDGDPHYHDDITMYLKATSYQAVDQFIEQEVENKGYQNISYINIKKNTKMEQNILLVIAILLYGFITLVTLIGVTSVFNTINTSMALRRKEFAMLRSMGLTPRGFQKILSFESIFFGVKSLLYGLPLSILVIIWIHVSMMNVNSFDEVLIPWKSIGIAVLGVFIIVYVTMLYASSKIKRENILDAIREENI